MRRGRGMSVSSISLVLSLFPGIGLLDMAFEEQGFCVVRGPDLLWGGDIRRFHAPAGRFDGVIGGPPCQSFSTAAMGKQRSDRDMIPEFVRVVTEAQPAWWLMENVRAAYTPIIEGYLTDEVILNNRWLDAGDGIGPEQSRTRKFVFGTRSGAKLVIDSLALLQNPVWERCVLAAETEAGHPGKGSYAERPTRRTVERQAELMGLPTNFFGDDSPFTMVGKGHMLGNGVPLPMGRAIARAVKAALTVATPA